MLRVWNKSVTFPDIAGVPTVIGEPRHTHEGLLDRQVVVQFQESITHDGIEFEPTAIGSSKQHASSVGLSAPERVRGFDQRAPSGKSGIGNQLREWADRCIDVVKRASEHGVLATIGGKGTFASSQEEKACFHAPLGITPAEPVPDCESTATMESVADIAAIQRSGCGPTEDTEIGGEHSSSAEWGLACCASTT